MNAWLGRRLKLVGKRMFFPGLDLHTRCRYRFLASWLRSGDIDTLDAGSGNGALCYAAYRRGNCVLGVTLSDREVRDTNALFRAMKIPTDRVAFRQMNIYDLRKLDQTFDQIVCAETLEHITRDAEVVEMFSDLLRPGGSLLLCCPNAPHPENALGRTDEPETGYHVRDGYTLDSYQALFAPAGLRITQTLGLGSPLLCRLDRVLREVRRRVGDMGAFPLFLAMLPFTRLDYTNPTVPFSLAVLAVKEA